MADRRTFLKIGAAASLAPVAAGGAGLAGAAAAPRRVVTDAVFDERFETCRAVAERLAAEGVRLQAIRGDVTELWLKRLDATWRHPAGALAGVTDANALFVLERLAWDRRLRVVYRAEAPAPAEAIAAWSASVSKALLKGGAWSVSAAPEPVHSSFGGADASLQAWVIAPMVEVA